MSSVFAYLIAAYGLSNMLVYGKGPFDILSWFRKAVGRVHSTFKDMLSCMMCTSANVGWIVSVLNILFFPSVALVPSLMLLNAAPWWVCIPFDMCITTGAVWLMHTLQETLETVTNWLSPEDGE